MADPIVHQLAPEQSALLEAIGAASARLHVDLFLVGGAVRDALLERTSEFPDVVAVAPPEGFAQALAAELGGAVESQSQFGTFKLRLGGGLVDLATARRETYEYPGALPRVYPGSIEDDLARRDFTVNAMALPLSPGFGELLDPFDGQGDVGERLIRVLHPKSFVDDATRILRAIRFAERLDFALKPSTAEALTRDLGYLDSIKGHRLRSELERIFREPRAAPMLRRARDAGVLSAIYEGMTIDDSTLAKLDALRPDRATDGPLVFLAAMAYSMTLSAVEGICTRLNMDDEWSRAARDSAGIRSRLPALSRSELRPSEVHSLLTGIDERSAIGASLAVADPVVAKRLRDYESTLRHVTADLTGDDLLAMGVPQGPHVGELLRELLAARLDGVVTDLEGERSLASKRMGAADI